MTDQATLKMIDEQVPQLKNNYPVFRYMAGNLISFLGDQIYLIALPLIVLSLTGSPLIMGIVSALERLPIWLQPLTGVLADRLNRKNLLMVCDLGRCLIIGLLGVFFIMGHLDMWCVYVGAFAIGTLSQIYNTSQFASVPKLVRKSDLQAVNSLQSGFLNTATLLGPGLGGMIISFYNPGYALLINSCSFFISFLAILSISLGQQELNYEKRKSLYSEIGEGFKFVIKTKPILFSNLAILTSMSGTTLFLTLMIFHLKEVIDLSAVQIGWLVSLGGIGAIVGALLTNVLTKRMSHRTLLFVSSFLGGISIILFSYAHTFVWLVLFNALGDLLASMMNPCIITIRQTLTPDHLLGRVQATSRFMSWIFLPLSSFLAGAIALKLGSYHTILIGGIISSLAALFYLHPSLKGKGKLSSGGK
jgi:MFS family permease